MYTIKYSRSPNMAKESRRSSCLSLYCIYKVSQSPSGIFLSVQAQNHPQGFATPSQGRSSIDEEVLSIVSHAMIVLQPSLAERAMK